MNKYRVEAGYPAEVVGQVDTDEQGVLVSVPPIWAKFKDQKLHRLEWWLTWRYGSCRKQRICSAVLMERGEPNG